MSAESGMDSEDTSLAEALRTVAKQLQNIAERLPAAASTQPNAEKTFEDDLDAEAIINKEAGWETARDVLVDQNHEMVDSWKDELNNLLVFAGLFSAVVTAFTVESYTWLQLDSGDASNMLLARISLQLSVFTSGSGFVNSSSPALPLQTVTSSFTPAEIAVTINTLWVLSLTLSLLSAFFAIAVQQWLRQLRLPHDAPVRRAVQLLSLRSDALQRWQIPSIISLLPLLLQIAVVLFLVGLFLLLRSLNATVTIAFAAVAATGLSTFLITAFIPLITIRCPYKSPLVPTVLVVLQWFSYFATVIYIAIIVVSLSPIILLSLLEDSVTGSKYVERFLNFLEALMAVESVLEYVASFSNHSFVHIAQFWLHREYQHILSLDDDDTFTLECSSFVHVLLSAGSRSFAKVLRCMHDFKSQHWLDILAYHTVVKSLSVVVPVRIGLYGLIDLDVFKLIPKIAPYARKWRTIRHHYLFWDALRQRDWAKNGQVSRDDSLALVLFYELDKTVSAAPEQYVKYLLHICANHRVSEHCNYWEATPVCLIFDTMRNGYIPNGQDAQTLATFADQCFSLSREHGWHPEDEAMIVLCLASSTSALVAMSAHPSIAATQGLKLVVALSDFLASDQTKYALKTLLKDFYDDPGEIVESTSITPMIPSLCEALVKLAKNHHILQNSQCPSIRLANALHEVCTGFDQRDIVQACEHLDEFTVSIPDWAIGWRARELLRERLDGYLMALVLAEESLS